MRRRVVATVLAVSFLFTIGCATHIHKVGNGPQGNDVVAERQWYVVWGLAPINKIDSNTIAGGATDYEIKTESTFIDVLISAVLGWTSIHARTVTVHK